MTKTKGNKTVARRNGWRKSGNWEWAKNNAELFHDILPEDVSEAALATCRITLRDKNSTAAGGAWGFAVLTKMQTFGHKPEFVPGRIRRSNNFITLQSIEGADAILGCVGLTLMNVIDHFGRPGVGEKITLDLYEIVKAIFGKQTMTQVA